MCVDAWFEFVCLSVSVCEGEKGERERKREREREIVNERGGETVCACGETRWRACELRDTERETERGRARRERERARRRERVRKRDNVSVRRCVMRRV